MKINDLEITKDNVEMLVWCIPLSEFKNPPPSQVGCEKEACPGCNNEMWASKRKRELRKKDMQLVCWFCLINILNILKIDPRNVSLIDITTTNWKNIKL